MKDTFYFSHDQNARGDIKCVRLIREMKWEGYGIYWALIEMLYESKGKIEADFDLIAYDLRANPETVKKIVTGFDLFYRKGKIIGSHSVDRRLEDRQARVESARASANARWGNPDAMRSHSGGNARNEVKKESKETKTTATPSAVDRLIEGINTDVPKDYFAWRFPKGFNAKYAGAFLINVPVDECGKLLNTPRLGMEIKAALEWRIEQKRLEQMR